MLLTILACSVLAAPQRIDPAVQAAQAVVKRVFPKVASAFRFEKLAGNAGPLTYEYSADNGVVTVKGASGVAMCRGAYDYLRAKMGAQATWGGTTLGTHAGRLPDAPTTKGASPYRWVLQDNVCVFGYTTAFHGWREWERYLDMMALHGINMQFAPVGGETVWAKVWKSFGVSQKDLDNFFTGPAFLPWHRMGNVNKHDGPLPASYLTGSVALQKKILARMRSLGIEPVAPGFAGFVPPGFAEQYPKEKVIHVASWAGFGDDYRTWILHPLSKMYSEIGGRYIKEWRKEFGPARYYLADSFNELEVPVPAEKAEKDKELAAFGRAVYDGVRAGDPQGTWVMQGWLFYNAGGFWDKDAVAALLSKVPNDRMIILDLFAEAVPIWKRHAFFGKEWIVSTITTWGGNNQPYGNFEAYSKLSADTLAAPNHGKLVGFGISFEGAESNEAQFEMLCDSAWSSKPIDITRFLQTVCVKDRYGVPSAAAERAWTAFEKTAYRMGFGVHPNHLLQGRPHSVGPTARGSAHDSPEFRQGVEDLLAARAQLGKNQLYRADLLQFTAHWALSAADAALRDAVVAQSEGLTNLSVQKQREFEELALAADRLLASHPLDRLERWVGMARAWGKGAKEKDYYEADAKRQVTVWGGPILSEYAAKMWSGLVAHFYVPRWTAWLESKRAGTPWDMRAWEEHWITTPGSTSTTPFKDPLQAAADLVARLKSIEPSDLTERVYGKAVGSWKSGEQTETYAEREWPISDPTPGDWLVRFQYTGGPHRLDIDGVQLLEDSKVVAEDKHFGRTGDENVDNVFRLKLAAVKPGARYSIRAKVKSAGGSDSNGTIYLRIALPQ